MTLPEDIPVVTEPSESRLNPRQLQDYTEHRETFLEWLFVFGKAPEKAEGYSKAVVKNTAYRTIDVAYCFSNGIGIRSPMLSAISASN